MLEGNVLKQIGLFLLFITLCMRAFAVDLELTEGVHKKMPISVQSFGVSDEAINLTQTIKNDLAFTEQFQLMAQSYGSKVDSILKGEVISLAAGRFEVHYELIDAAANGRRLLSKQYQITLSEMHALAHHISDEIYEKLTGEKGIFSTLIAYIRVNRNPLYNQYALEIAEYDGSHPHTILVSSEPIMSPTWSHDGNQIAYVSFEKRRAQIYTIQVATGKRRLLTNFEGINGAPAFSKDGQEMTVVLSKTGSPKLYRVNLSTGLMTQLTFGEAIDTEPQYAPDGRSILFTSGREGHPQIYKINLADGKINRITFIGDYNARASYTPNQRQIVMMHRENKLFSIAVQDLTTGQVTALTDSPHDESPVLSPNGRFVLYETKVQDRGVLAVASLDGQMRRQLPAREGDIQEPTWSPHIG